MQLELALALLGVCGQALKDSINEYSADLQPAHKIALQLPCVRARSKSTTNEPHVQFLLSVCSLQNPSCLVLFPGFRS